METLVPHVLLAGRYELQQRLADDGRCSVWRATDDVLQRTVVVRVFLGDADGVAAEPARRASQLTHPGILAIFDVGGTAEESFVVTEPEPGPSLASLVARSGPLTPERAAALAIQVLDACRAAQATGMRPPAVDPREVWLDDTGQVKVGFGLEAGEHLGATDREQIAAIGGLLYLGLTASAVNAAPGEDPATGPRTPRAIDPRIPRDLERITMRALGADDPDESFEDLAALSSALTRVSRALPAPGPSPAPTAEDHHSMFRSWMLVPIALVLVTGAVLAAGLALGRLEIGGPLGVRPAPVPAPEPTGAGGGDAAGAEKTIIELNVRSVRSHDPFGDGTEGETSAPLAIDGNRSTAWRSENYFDVVLNKPGMGLLFDLGRPMSVEKFRLFTQTPGFEYELRVGDDAKALAAQRRGHESFTADAIDRNELPQPATGRYVLLWITSVPGEGDDGAEHRASVSELILFGRDR